MSNYIYTRGYTVAELEALLVRVKAEREKYLQSASDSGSSYSRIAFSEIEKKFNGIMDALELLAPEKYPKTNRRNRPTIGRLALGACPRERVVHSRLHKRVLLG